jgi:DNA-binding NarL/FixJ family response regulator
MPFPGPVKVLVVDDHIGIRNGIASLMNAEWPRISCVGAVATADETLQLVQERQPHVVVLDVNLAGDDGLALIPRVQSLTPCKVVVLTSLSDPHVAARAQRLGAYACLHKTAPATELVACVFAAHLTCEDAASELCAAAPMPPAGLPSASDALSEFSARAS